MDRPEKDELWNARQAAAYLSCSVQHVLRLATLGHLPAVNLAPPGARQCMWRFRQEALREWVQQRERNR